MGKGKRISKFRVALAILVVGLIVWSGFKIYKYFFPGTDIDQVAIKQLSNDEIRALKKFGNIYHLEAARQKGIPRPFDSQQEMLDNKYHFIVEYNLKEVQDNRYYEVPKLTHSLPYLKKDAVDFLNELGERFYKAQDDLGVRHYRFSVTSILRALNDQKGLRKSNVNATKNMSSHYYATTFDIAQTRFFEQGKPKPIYSYRLRNLLLRELIKMQEEGKCYVLLEHQTKCIHVTVR
jgi:hypothetical protein